MALYDTDTTHAEYRGSQALSSGNSYRGSNTLAGSPSGYLRFFLDNTTAVGTIIRIRIANMTAIRQHHRALDLFLCLDSRCCGDCISGQIQDREYAKNGTSRSKQFA
ncbi:unnamed protein product [Cercospora beticola]|nr:unnamed protein product [Cercospora beticola]